mmetsp:Transcript_21890/g.55297  ORF Transcript_21890/g.55297 Transcript_21890/m.55297 type:complete len:217 (-) Transcript_21890:195-845(-)
MPPCLAALDMLTTTPPLSPPTAPAANSRVQRKAPVRFTLITEFQSSRVAFLAPRPVALSFLISIESLRSPALLTRTLQPPMSSLALAKRAPTSSSLVTSAACVCTLPGGDALPTSSTVLASPTSSRSVATTVAPLSHSRLQNHLPSPPPAPVTTTLDASSLIARLGLSASPRISRWNLHTPEGLPGKGGVGGLHKSRPARCVHQSLPPPFPLPPQR